MAIRNPVSSGVCKKFKNDAERLCSFARFVIALENGSVRIIDNAKRHEKKLPYARLIAVLGPAEHNGMLYEQAMLLEIGYGRSRPYSCIEQRALGRGSAKRWMMPSRRKVRDITPEELSLAYPHIVECIKQIVIERRENWKVKGAWWVDGPGPVERGIHFTIHESDDLLYRQALLEDIRFRRISYIYGHARRIKRFIAHYKYVDYSRKQLMRFAGTDKVITLVRDQYADTLHRQALLRSLGRNSKAGRILEHIGEQFGLGFDCEDERTRRAFSEAPIKLPPMRDLYCLIGKQPTVHARDCVVAEFILERRFRERTEIPF